MIRPRYLLALLPCLMLVGCGGEKPAPASPASSATPSSPAAAPTQDDGPRPQTTSDLIHNWRLPDPDKYKYTCPEGYRLDTIPYKDRQPDKSIIHCRSKKDPSLPPKPVIVKPS